MAKNKNRETSKSNNNFLKKLHSSQNHGEKPREAIQLFNNLVFILKIDQTKGYWKKIYKEIFLNK